MARSRVPDGGDGLQLWRVAVIYCISSRGQPTRCDPSAWGLDEEPTTSCRKKSKKKKNL